MLYTGIIPMNFIHCHLVIRLHNFLEVGIGVHVLHIADQYLITEDVVSLSTEV